MIPPSLNFKLNLDLLEIFGNLFDHNIVMLISLIINACSVTVSILTSSISMHQLFSLQYLQLILQETKKQRANRLCNDSSCQERVWYRSHRCPARCMLCIINYITHRETADRACIGSLPLAARAEEVSALLSSRWKNLIIIIIVFQKCRPMNRFRANFVYTMHNNNVGSWELLRR